VRVEDALDLGRFPTDHADSSLWWRHERLHRRLLRAPAAQAGAYLDERDALEAAWLMAPPAPADAFARHGALVDAWNARLDAQGMARDARPWYVRRYWRERNARAGLDV
jgi:secernin